MLITYYNERGLLRECLESLLEQRERPDEILVYDDASEFPPGEYIPSRFSVRVIREETNKGPAHGRNQLLKASRCDYVHFHDSDDLFHPQWCQRVRQAMEETKPDAVFTEISSYRGDRLFCERVLGLKPMSSTEEFIRFCIRGVILVPAGTYRKERVLAIGGYRESLWQSEDFDFHVRLAASGIKPVILDDPLVSIRIRSLSRSQNQREVWTWFVEAIRLLSKELPPKYRFDLAETAARAGSTLFGLGARKEARAAFAVGKKVGPPTFKAYHRLYRLLATTLGQETAEWAGVVYRKVLPERVRCLVKEHPFMNPRCSDDRPD